MHLESLRKWACLDEQQKRNEGLHVLSNIPQSLASKLIFLGYFLKMMSSKGTLASAVHASFVSLFSLDHGSRLLRATVARYNILRQRCRFNISYINSLCSRLLNRPN